jgi:adenine specific DNA methylase Mod
MKRNNYKNILYLGDNLKILNELKDTYLEKVDLIYIDPPFNSDRTYSKTVIKDNKLVKEIQYKDSWKTDEYLEFLYERLLISKEFLSKTGSIYVHIDPKISHKVRSILDEIYSPDNFVNEIIWTYKTGGIPEVVGFARKHDSILLYSKTSSPYFSALFQKSFAPTLPEPYTNSGIKLGVKREESCSLCFSGIPGQKYRMVRMRDVWDDINPLFRNNKERTDYPTQKPEALLNRIITASCPENGLVLDFFAGSGTTLVSAAKLNRYFIGIDSNQGAIDTIIKRLDTNKIEYLLG